MSDKLDPFKLFQIYHAVFLHYTTDYDYQKYQGKTSYKQETFEHRKDKYSYHKLVRVLEFFDYRYFEYYVAWLFLEEDKWVTTKTIENKITDFETTWRNYSDARSMFIKEETNKLESLESQHVFEMLRCGEIHLQTLLILDKVKGGLITKMNEDLKGKYLWDSGYKKLIKFRPFYAIHEPIHEIYFKPYISETCKWANQ